MALSDRGLTTVEKAKFDLVQPQLSRLFEDRGKVVRICEGSGEGFLRQIAFVDDSSGVPFLTVPAHWFTAVAADDLLSRLKHTL